MRASPCRSCWQWWWRTGRWRCSRGRRRCRPPACPPGVRVRCSVQDANPGPATCSRNRRPTGEISGRFRQAGCSASPGGSPSVWALSPSQGGKGARPHRRVVSAHAQLQHLVKVGAAREQAAQAPEGAAADAAAADALVAVLGTDLRVQSSQGDARDTHTYRHCQRRCTAAPVADVGYHGLFRSPTPQQDSPHPT